MGDAVCTVRKKLTDPGNPSCCALRVLELFGGSRRGLTGKAPYPLGMSHDCRERGDGAYSAYRRLEPCSHQCCCRFFTRASECALFSSFLKPGGIRARLKKGDQGGSPDRASGRRFRRKSRRAGSLKEKRCRGGEKEEKDCTNRMPLGYNPGYLKASAAYGRRTSIRRL